MPKPSLIINEAVAEDQWQLIRDENNTAIPSDTRVIVPLTLWQTSPTLQQRDDVGLLLPNTVELTQVTIDYTSLPLIAIDFPVFMDGRGFSIARLLRERYQYTGELRAVGHIIRDQLCYLKRCGFNAFCLNEDVDLNHAITSLTDFTEAYQSAADERQPLFRRRI